MQTPTALAPVVIAGGTGTLGLATAQHLKSQGYHVVLLTRSLKPNLSFEQLLWDGKSVDESWGARLAGSILINLAGELVDRLPTKKNIRLLKSSRTEPTLALVTASERFGRPKLWLQASTLAIYGDAGDRILDEGAKPANGPEQMAGVAKAWEAAVTQTAADRVVWLRTAVVLQSHTPALARLTKITRRFLGGTVSHGRQWVSWIHITDYLRAFDFVIAGDDISGIIHVCSPKPITNRALMTALRKALHRPWMPPTPTVMIKLGAWLLFKTDPALALTGRRAVPKVLNDAGFEFQFSDIDQALRDLCS